jgi:hypothetical protein
MRTLVLFLLVACASSSSGPAAPPPADPTRTCEDVLRKMRTCSAEFIPALVDLRIQYDRPPGIKSLAEQNGRDALVEGARKEWETDSSDENIVKLCVKMKDESSPEMQELVEAGKKCLEHQACDAAVACVIPLIEAPWKSTP